MPAALLLLVTLQFLPEQVSLNLVHSARQGNVPLTRAWLAMGAQVDARHGLTGWTALHAAAFYGHLEVARALVDAGANVNARDRRDGTPLMKAVALPGDDAADLVPRKVAILKLLLERGADPQLRDRLGGTAWQTPLILGPPEFVDVFEQAGVRGVREALLMEAIARQDAPGARKWIGLGADVNYKDETGWNAAAEAVLTGNTELIRMVLDAGADPAVSFDQGRTLLMIAALYDRADAIPMLLAAGADPAARSDAGLTALDMARAHGSENAARILSDRMPR
jgi:ankyrin repeat protein